MKIVEITPKVERKYSLEFSENELKNLGMIVGSIGNNDLKTLFTKTYAKEQMNNPKFINRFNHDLYDIIQEAINKK